MFPNPILSKMSTLYLFNSSLSFSMLHLLDLDMQHDVIKNSHAIFFSFLIILISHKKNRVNAFSPKDLFFRMEL
jgi:hypothetical protein